MPRQLSGRQAADVEIVSDFRSQVQSIPLLLRAVASSRSHNHSQLLHDYISHLASHIPSLLQHLYIIRPVSKVMQC